jgi:hypothetical protein
MVIDKEFGHQTDTNTTSPVNGSALDDLITKIRAWAVKYAEKNGRVLSLYEEEPAGLLKGLAANRLKFGKQYCPCRIRSSDPETEKRSFARVSITGMRSRRAVSAIACCFS